MEYIVEIPLPFSLRLPLNAEFEFFFSHQRCIFVHLERTHTLTSGIQLGSGSHIAADKYGLYLKSKVLLVLPSEIVEE